MAINNRLVTEIIDRTSPYIEKGAKRLEHIKGKIKPTEETAEEVAKSIESTEPERWEVAPFAERLIHPTLFGLDPSINSIKATVRNTQKMISQAKDENVRKCFIKLYGRIINDASDIEGWSGDIVTVMQKVDMLENPKIKNSLIKYLNRLVKKPEKVFKEQVDEKITFVEDFADAVNTINGKYMRTDSEPAEFYKWMKKNNVWLLDVIENTRKGESDWRKRLITSKKCIKSHEDYLKLFDEFSKRNLPETFQNDLRADAMRNYIYEYGEKQPKAVKILYYEEFLKTLPQDIARECAEVNKLYGTYIIPTNADLTVKDIKYVKEELRLWQKAGKGEERLPSVLTVDTLDEYMQRENVSGYAEMCGQRIAVRDLLVEDGKKDSVGTTLRHEIQHLQDDKLVEIVDCHESRLDDLKWAIKKWRHKDQWKKELEKGGISDKDLIEYALTEPCELMSVTTEADMRKLSEEYKDSLSKDFGMKKWIFNLDDNEVMKDSRRRDLARSLTERAMKEFV